MAVLQRIAVADDEPIIREFYCRVLFRRGLEVVVVARDGSELVDGCRAERPDLIICDARMPVMNGMDAIDDVARWHRPTPAIVISAVSGSELFSHSGSRYVLDFLTKPVDMHNLERAISGAEQQLQVTVPWHA